ncbi:MAG: aspartate/tyrosine/aromatic aminotransferase [Reinekea sp.]
MFETIAAPKGDPILTLIQEFQNDPRSDKIDLGIGVYRDNSGRTPIMKAVADAEKYLLENEITKAYQGLAGDEVFNGHLQSLLLSGTQAEGRASTLQTPGASGALRMLADLIATTRPNATVWLSNPSYINHRPIMERAGLTVKTYPYLSMETKAVDEIAMLEQIETLGQDDVLLLHGCCHNPSGADISLEAWQKIAGLASKNGFLPFVDIAYQGLGDGLSEDAKNFGLYRERIGGAIIVAKTAEIARNSRAKVCELARGTYSMPPAHGAAIVRTILQDESRRQSWQQELNAMNQRVNGLRKSLVESFRLASQSERFDFFGHHKGMFSLTDFSDDLISQLKAEHGIYIVAGGRINVAGLRESQVVTLVNAVITAGG